VKHGIDWARMHESRLAYAFHVLIGHHGLFSLTPVWFLSLAGVVGRGRGWYRQSGPIWLYLVTALVSVAVIGFYLVKSDNYGGWTSGLRWLFWLTPLNLLVMIPAADAWMARHWGRIVALTFLAVSVLSAAYPSANPWRHPWIYRWLESQGIVQY
jgi:Zn-dependent protease with chaperone function